VSVSYHEWVQQEEEQISSKSKAKIPVKVVKKVMMRSTVKEAVAVLLSKLSDQMGHRYRILHQQEQWKILREGKSDKDLLIN